MMIFETITEWQLLPFNDIDYDGYKKFIVNIDTQVRYFEFHMKKERVSTVKVALHCDKCC